MARAANIVGEAVVAQGRFALTLTEVEVVEPNGETRRLSHEIYRHGDAAAVLLYDPARQVVTLVSQFRLGAYLNDGALASLEICAGMLDGDAPDACAVREAFEETGVGIAAPRHAFDAFMSPGGMTEKIAFFVAAYGAADRVGGGGGVDHDEDIEVVEIPFAEAVAMIDRGEIRDAKTIALLCWAKLKGLIG